MKPNLPVGHTKFNAMIETPDTFFRIHAIVKASDRIVATTIGGEDLALESNFEPTGEALLYPKPHMVIAADEEATRLGCGSGALDGKMIDIPIIVRAPRLRARHAATKAREAKTLAALQR